jgi:hypothetical protein
MPEDKATETEFESPEKKSGDDSATGGSEYERPKRREFRNKLQQDKNEPERSALRQLANMVDVQIGRLQREQANEPAAIRRPSGKQAQSSKKA